MNGEKIIGIDLGTTNSVVAVMEGGESRVIANQEGNRTTPSVIAFTAQDETLVGEPARRQAITNPTNTVYSIKRFMGRRHSEVESEEKIVPYEVTGSTGDYVKIRVNGREHTPPEMSAHVLRKLKEAAENYLGQQVNKAVITVPAYFNDAQRQATKDAGAIAGLEVARIINEPTAAALAYGLDRRNEEKIIVFDLGGGTFDISILEVGDDLVEVLSTNGDTHLGGDEFDEVLIDHIADDFQQKAGIDLRKDAMALQRLRESTEKAKKELSSSQSTDINLPFITADAGGARHLQVTITRAQFEKLIAPLIEQCRKPIEQALADANLQPSDIQEVVLVGGSTRVPVVQQFVNEFFGRTPHRGVNPDEVVAIGAAIQGGIIAGDVKDVVLLDVTPISLGIETEGGVFTRLIERNTTLPTTKSEVFSTAADNQTAVTVRVFQGEREMAADNRLLAEFNLDEIPPAPRGAPQIEVTFDIDVNGILDVSATDKATGKEQSIQIKESGGLSEHEIEQIRRDAEAHASEDHRRRKLAETKNLAFTAIYQTEKLLKEHESRMDEHSKAAIQTSIQKVRQVESSDDADSIVQAVDNLNEAVQAWSAHLDQQNAENATGPHGSDTAESTYESSNYRESGNEDVIDAEFTSASSQA